MKKWVLLLLFFVSYKTQTPNGKFFWTRTTEGFTAFYEATEFIEKLFINPLITEIKIEKLNGTNRGN